MKKLVYTLAVIFTLSLVTVSCTKQELNNEEQLIDKERIRRPGSRN